MSQQAEAVGLRVVGVETRDHNGVESRMKVQHEVDLVGEELGRFAAMTVEAPSGRHLEVGIGVTVVVPPETSTEECHQALALVADMVDGRLTEELARVSHDAGAASEMTHLREGEYHDALIADVAAAESSVLMASPWTGYRMDSLLKPLCDAVSRGAEVTVLIKPEDSANRWARQRFWNPLEECGVNVVEYHDKMHEKFVVIDSNITYQGSLNPGSHKDTTESSMRIKGVGPARLIRDLYHPESGAAAAAKEVRITSPARVALGDDLGEGVAPTATMTSGTRWETTRPSGPHVPPNGIFD